MRMVPRIVLGCALLALAFVNAAAQKGAKPAKPFHTEGVFSNITAGTGGDYGGMQVYLTDSDGQFYAAVTIAEGVLQPPVLVKVNVEVEARKIEFELPGADGPRKFKGTVTAAGLTLEENGRRQLLKRKCLD